MFNQKVSIGTSNYSTRENIPNNLIVVCCILSFFLFVCSFLRHQLFNSNVADLGLFDQWIWLMSQGIQPISSMAQVHFLADHAAWVVYFMAPIYKILPTVNWLFLTQALALSFTAVPLWRLSLQAKLNRQLCWLICLIWWLQPVVFNVNLFDFHPEVWAMPALAYSYLMLRKGNILAWFLFIVFVIGCRDGMVLIVAGISIDQFIRRHWKIALFSALISFGWFFFITFSLFPYLKNFSDGMAGATESNISTISRFISSPLQEILSIDLLGGLSYLVLISIAFIPFWNRRAFPTLAAWIPLLALNFISQNPSFRTLIHQYNLPIALIGVISIIDSLTINNNKISFNKLIWISVCWFLLAKPYFFTGPYLSRIPELRQLKEAISLVPDDADVLTTSYIAPHLSHRKNISYPQNNFSPEKNLKNFDVLLLNPIDPGWDSSGEKQYAILKKANQDGWECSKFGKGIELCFSQ